MAYKRYVLLKDSDLEPSAKAGAVVYDLRGWDYGLASDDTRNTGKQHISVTIKEDGDYPSFTVPMSDLQEIRTGAA